MEKQVYKFEDLGNWFSFDSDTVSFIIDEERKLKKTLDTNKELSGNERELIRRRIRELQYMYSDHNEINLATNDQLLNSICESINGMNDIVLRQYHYYFPFGIYGSLEVSDDYLKSIGYNSEAFRKDLFDKVGFEYTALNDIINEDGVDFDLMHQNGIRFNVSRDPEYGVDFSFFRVPSVYMKNKDFAPKVKMLKK